MEKNKDVEWMNITHTWIMPAINVTLIDINTLDSIIFWVISGFEDKYNGFRCICVVDVVVVTFNDADEFVSIWIG